MMSEIKLEATLKPIGIPVKYCEYLGTEEIYIVYNEEAEEPVDYGDNQPLNNVTWWQVHIFAPKASDFRKYKKDAVNRLQEAGYIVTDIVTLYEEETKTIHVVIACHIEEVEE